MWSTPAIDARRNAVYVTTGNNYTDPATRLSDAFVAMDLNSGKILWSRQMTPRDAYTVRVPAARQDQLRRIERSGFRLRVITDLSRRYQTESAR